MPTLEDEEAVPPQVQSVETHCPASPLEVEIESHTSKAVETQLPGCHIPGFGFLAYKYVALLLLVVQTVLAIFVMRISRTTYAHPETPYLITSAVTMSEIIKLLLSTALVWRDVGYSTSTALAHVRTEIFDNPVGTLKVGVPAFLYTLQNNLLFIALSNISGAVYQVTYQLKILSTALLTVVILRRKLSSDRWISLVMLTLGVGLIQIPTSSSSSPSSSTSGGDPLLGVVAVLAACGTSGLAGVYLEKVLKDSKTSIWLRNMQLALLGVALALIGAFWSNGREIISKGFFQGFNTMTWIAILLQSAGGLIVAAVLKYADNILKCFGNAVAIILSCLVSYYVVGDYQPSFLFGVGTLLVTLATYTYGVNYPMIYTASHPKLVLKPIARK